MLIDSLLCSFRNLGRKKFRSFLTIASIAIGVASVVLIGSIGQIGKKTINDELSSLGLGSLTVSADTKLTRVRMTEQDLELLRGIPSVKTATPIVVTYTNSTMRGLVANTVLLGMDETNSGLVALTPKYGRMLTEADVAGAADVCVIDSNMARIFYKRENIVGKHLNAMIGGSYVRLEIVGIASSGGSIMQTMVGDVIPSFAYLPYTTLQRYANQNTFDQIAVTLEDGVSPETASEQLAAAINRLHNLERGFKADNVSAQKDTLNHVMEIITHVLSAIAAVSLVVSGLGIMTVMIVSVNERTREIGIKKSIGATRSMILLEFMIEAFVISFVGSLIGLGTGLLVVWGGCLLFSLPVTLDFHLIFTSLLLSIGIGVAFGVYPSTVAAKMRPADALRTE